MRSAEKTDSSQHLINYCENLSVLKDTQRVSDALLVVGFAIILIVRVDLVILCYQTQIEPILHIFSRPLFICGWQLIIGRDLLIGGKHYFKVLSSRLLGFLWGTLGITYNC